MARMLGGGLAVLVLVVLAPSVACAESHACADRATPRWLARATLGLSLVPFGAEIQARGAACVPLYPRSGDWFDGAKLEVGVLMALSPVYVQGGGYVQLTPTNLVSFRLEAVGIDYWPLPLDGAGYYALPSADTPRNETTLAAALGQSATGYTLRAVTVLQATLPIDPLALLVQSTFFGEHTEIGPGDYFVNLQVDQIQRRADLVFGNDSVLVLEIPMALTGGPSIRIGGYESYRHVLATGGSGNQAGAVAVLGWSHLVPEIPWLEVGLRGGGYTYHPIRTGEFTLAAWCSIELDLGPI